MAGDGSIESGISGIAANRVGAVRSEGILRRAEDFAIDNMRSLTIGASAALVLMAGVLMLNEIAAPEPATGSHIIDSTVTGSVAGQIRVPQGPEWHSVRKPVEIMSLQAPQLDRQGAVYAARRSARGDREDAILWQGPAIGGLEARIALVRKGTEHGAAPSLFVDMTRQQAERGIAVTRTGAPGLLNTKFGQVEIADMTFSDAGGVSQACLAFRRLGEGSEPTISGWQCAPQGAVVERPEIACFIDRLILLKSGDDQALRKYFTEAEPRRRPCPNTRTTAGRKPTWLDHDGRAPAMRGAEETTGSITRSKR